MAARVRRPVGCVAADERQLEDQLVEAVGALEVAQRAAAEQRPERRLDRRAQAGRHGSPGRRRRRSGARGSAATCSPSSASRSGGGEVGRLEDAVHEGADLDAGRHLGEQRRHAAHRSDSRSSSSGGAGAGGARRRLLVVDDALLGLARHPRLVGAGGDVAVGRAPPAPVEVAVEAGRAEVRRPSSPRPPTPWPGRASRARR